MVFIIFSNIYNIWQIFFYFFLWEINLSVGQSDCLSVRERQSDMLDSHLAKPASERVNQLNRHCDEESFVCPSVRQSVRHSDRWSINKKFTYPIKCFCKPLVCSKIFEKLTKLLNMSLTTINLSNKTQAILESYQKVTLLTRSLYLCSYCF